jgi:glycosyltransferase involved in cell wall biosynthesis
VSSFPDIAQHYLLKHQLVAPQIIDLPSAQLGLVIVIPCYDEPDLITTLASLWRCQRPGCAVEVIVVINASTADCSAVHAQNWRTYHKTATWIAQHKDPGLRFHLLHFPNLNPQQAGVGLARKLGMDEALGRFLKAGKAVGVMASLDADCVCASNYLICLTAHFAQHPKTPGCTLYFEHPLEDNVDPRLREGIIHYELFLRYYVQGLRFSGFPYAYHTLGSCMAVRSDVYAKQGGMNRRQGGEDFYFLQKITSLGNFSEILDTTVIPSPRASHRAPFGTGKAQCEWLANKQQTSYLSYAPQVFLDLQTLFANIDRFYTVSPHESSWLTGLPKTLMEYLIMQRFPNKLQEIQQHVASVQTFRKRFLHWFNAFQVLKFVHWATEFYYPKQPVADAAAQLLAWQTPAMNTSRKDMDVKTLMLHFRDRDRQDQWLPSSRQKPLVSAL